MGAPQLQAKKHPGLLANHHRRPERGEGGSHCRFHRELGPGDTLMSDFQSPELRGDAFLLFEAISFVALC